MSTGRAADGYHHPASEEELRTLVLAARREGRLLRVRGSGHSVSHAIYAAPGEAPNSVATGFVPAGDQIEVMLDRYRSWRVRSEERKLVEVDAGIHLGADPSDPSGTATLENGLLAQLAETKGWSLSNTGGITHQTVSGFLMTGSSGGSLQHSANANVHGVRIIDGRGDVRSLSLDDDPRALDAVLPSVGLLGVVSTVTLQCTDRFAIAGTESVAPVRDGPIDLFGDGRPGRPSLEDFLRETPFARIEWWPQRGLERMVIWQAARIPAEDPFEAIPYQRFGGSPEASQLLIAVLYAILGNLDDLAKAKDKLEDNFEEFERVLEATKLARRLGGVGDLLAKFLAAVTEGGIDAAITLLTPLAPLIRRSIPRFFPELASQFIPLDAEKPGKDRGQPQRFRDWGWRSLPMDNAVNDALLPAGFTEAWIPIGLAGKVMRLLDRHFSEPDDDHEAYRRTGTFVWEVYGAVPSSHWLNQAYSTGRDEWRDGVLRINPYWFGDNATGGAERFFAGLWNLLRDNDVPFRLHWGKYQPPASREDPQWVDFIAQQYPCWEDFLRLRAEWDPDDIFLTDYWRDRLGLWPADPPDFLCS